MAQAHAAFVNPLVRKLGLHAELAEDDRDFLDGVAGERARSFGAREDIVREGDPPGDINLFLTGWACRYKQLADGRRQILAWCLPGDVCDIHVFLLRKMDHSIGTIGPATVAQLSRERFEELAASRPRIIEALARDNLVNAAIQREWALNLGQRDATERIAHLFCELFVRLRAIGLTDGDGFDFPATQVELADTTGMSAVHVNRTIQSLRSQGLVIWNQKRVSLPDFDALARLSMFNPNYLHAGAS